MKDENKTKKQLIDELEELRQKIAVLEAFTIEHTPASNGLRESKERYSAIFNQAVDSIVLIDPETAALVDFNERAHKNLGYTREEFKKLKIADFEISETTEEIARHIKKILKAGSDTFETKHRTKDGQIRNINVCTGIIHIRGRKFVQSIFHDITEKKLVEGELVKTKDRLDNIIDSSLDSIAVSDGAGHLIRVNNSFLSLLGYRKEEVLKRHISELTPMMEGTYESTTGEPVQLDKDYFNNIDTAISTLLKDRKISSWESFWLRKDGKVVPTEQNIVYLYNDGEDAIEAVGIIRDISERKKVEKEIKEARDFLKSVIEGSRDGIVITDAKGHILSINTAMEQMCGFGKEKLIGKHSSTLVIDDKDMRRSIRDKVPELFEKGFTSYEAIHKNKD